MEASTVQRDPMSGFTTAFVFGIAIVALYLGREILVPFALAVLLSFMLAPVVDWLRQLRLPHIAAVGATVTLALVVLGGLSAVVGSQIVQLAQNLPDYQATMQEKIRSVRASIPEGGVLDRSMNLFETLRQELGPEPDAQMARAEQPAPVRLEPPPRGPLEVIGSVLAPLLGPIGMAGLVVVFLVFILLERYDLRDRFIRLAGGGLHRTTDALNEAALRVSRYLVTQLIVNATYGVPIGVGLYFIGVPNAFLWGLLATLLRFLPYVGPFIAALFPLALAFAVDPGWSMLIWTSALIIGMELLSNNIVEPWLYGTSTGLSPVAILFSAIFWTLLWGPAGLLLATPLTVCLAVMGRHVPRLEFLEVLLGNEPVLSVPERVYQRLLSGDVEEAIELAEAEVAAKSLQGFYDTTGIQTLRLAEVDSQYGLSPQHRKRVAEGLQAVVRELVGAQPEAGVTPVLSIAGRSELDAAAAAMLVHMLGEKGIGARCISESQVTPESINLLDLAGVEAICLSYLHPDPQTHARFVCRRLKRRKPDLKIVVGILNPAIGAHGAHERLARDTNADAVETSLAGALRRIEQLIAPIPPTMVVAPVPSDEDQRLEALYASGLIEARAAGGLDRSARRLADAFEIPIALISLIDETCQLWPGAAGLPADLEQSRQSPRETSVCSHVVAADAPIVVEDIAREPRFAGNPFLRARGIRFYAGAPLRTASGHVIGSLCIMDTKPRSLLPRDVKLLQALADELMNGMEKERAAARRDTVPELA